MHNFQSQMHGPAYASAFMRDYFLKNQGKPLPPAKPPRCGFAIFKSERPRCNRLYRHSSRDRNLPW